MWSSLYCGVKEIRRWWWCYCCFYFLECWLVALRHTCTQWRPPPAGAKRRQRRTRRCVPFRKGWRLAASPPVGESAQMAGHTRKLALCLSAAHTAIERFTAQLPWLPLSIRTLIVGWFVVMIWCLLFSGQFSNNACGYSHPGHFVLRALNQCFYKYFGVQDFIVFLVEYFVLLFVCIFNHLVKCLS